MALAVAGLSAGPASAAIHPVANTKAAWQADISHVRTPGSGCYRASYPTLAWRAVKCAAAPKVVLAPKPFRSATHAGPEVVGDGHDYSAQVSGLITKAVGTFTHVSSGITMKGAIGGTGSEVKNGVSLQLNSSFFTGSPACSGSTGGECQAWQQFVYTFKGCSVSCIFMQYWLIDYNATCPSGWMAYSNDCYTNSNAVQVGNVTAAELATLKLTGTAASGGNDTVSLSVGGGTATSVSGADSVVHLANFWNTTEWGVFGDGGGSEAHFGKDNTVQAQTALTASSGATAPTCVSEGFTGETNNLKLAKTAAIGSQPSPTMASKQTDGSAGTASCATAS
jgi:hypothetical protein